MAVKILDRDNEIKFQSLERERNILGWNHENIVKVLKVIKYKKKLKSHSNKTTWHRKHIIFNREHKLFNSCLFIMYSTYLLKG